MATGQATITDFSKGVRMDKAPTALEDGEIDPSRNIWLPMINGYPTWRPVANRIDIWEPGATGRFAFTGDFPNVPVSAVSFLAANGDPIAITAMGLGGSINGKPAYAVHAHIRGVSQDYATGQDWSLRYSLNRPQILIWNNKAYIFDAGEDPGWVLERNEADPANVFGGITTLEGGNGITRTLMSSIWPSGDQLLAGIAWIYQRQIVFAGIKGNPTMMRNTAIEDIGTLITETKSFHVGKGDGDPIKGGVEIAVEGGSTYFEPYSLVFKNRSTWLLQGSLPTTTDNGNYRLVRILGQGLVAKETIAKSKYGTIWCSGKNVWLATGGGSPVSIGDAIAPMLEKSDFNSGIWSGASFMSGEFYILTVPSEICGGKVTSAEQWWCDLRKLKNEGPEAVSWWGPMDIPGAVFGGPDPMGSGETGTYTVYGARGTGQAWGSGETAIGSMDQIGVESDQASGYMIDSWRVVPDGGPDYDYSAVDISNPDDPYVTMDDSSGLKVGDSLTDTFSGNVLNVTKIVGNDVHIGGYGGLLAPGSMTRSGSAPTIVQDPLSTYPWGFELVSKEYDGGTASIRKLIQRVIVNAKLGGTQKLWVRFQGNLGSEVNDPISAQAAAPGFILGTDTLGDPLGAGFKDLVYPSEASPAAGRFIAHTYQAVVYCAIEPDGPLPTRVSIKEITVVVRPLGRLP